MEQNLASPTTVRALLEQLAFTPSKSLGQNFLTDANIRDIIISNLNPQPHETILEVGPGLGVITEALLKASANVIAIELDRKLCEYLQQRFGQERLMLHHKSALEENYSKLFGKGINKVVSNLPYSVGTRILVDIIKANPQPEIILVTVQQEVGRRLIAQPGQKDYGILTLLAQTEYDITHIKDVSPRCFYPAPRVLSSIIMLEKRLRPIAEIADKKHYHQLIKCTFSQRRKQLGTLLRNLPAELNAGGIQVNKLVEELEIEPTKRPEEISISQWIKLSNKLS